MANDKHSKPSQQQGFWGVVYRKNSLAVALGVYRNNRFAVELFRPGWRQNWVSLPSLCWAFSLFTRFQNHKLVSTVYSILV